MTRLVLILVVTAGITAPAFADSALNFRRNGITYTATINEHRGTCHIVGQSNDGKSFELNVIGRHVTGAFNGMAVDYRMPADSSALTASR